METLTDIQQLIAVARKNGRVERLGELIDWISSNQDRLEQLDGAIVVRELLLELQRLNAIDVFSRPE